MASTLAGNFTVLGSIASLIVVQKAALRGVSISFRDYFKVGAPLTVLTPRRGHNLALLAVNRRRPAARSTFVTEIGITWFPSHIEPGRYVGRSRRSIYASRRV
jgi:hypothetical protein